MDASRFIVSLGAVFVLSTGALSGCGTLAGRKSDSDTPDARADAPGIIADAGSSDLIADGSAGGFDAQVTQPADLLVDLAADTVADAIGDTAQGDDGIFTDLVDPGAGDQAQDGADNGVLTDIAEDTGSPLVIPADRSILGYAGSLATDRNAAITPPGFTGPMETSCALDTTRVYIAELFTNGLKNIQVNYHWAPVVPGPDPAHPTIGQPEWSLSGLVEDAQVSGDDVLADHPFGVDFNFNTLLDPPFDFLGFNEDGGNNTVLHCEIPIRTFPRDAFGYTPRPGDRTLLRGAWVLDCGHPPYGAELHPPAFLAFARATSPTTTAALAFVAPYRSSLLFSPSIPLAAAFDDTERFIATDTAPMEQALLNAVLRVVSGKAERLVAHGLMLANRFDSLDFLVCAPLPRPKGVRLDASWRFTSRTGVLVTAVADDRSGCVRIRAKMSADYKPMPLPHRDADWPWEQLSKSASGQLGQPIDVRKELIKLVRQLGLDPDVPALQESVPPLVDAYEALAPLPDANLSEPKAIIGGADEQAFPFYGRVRASWK